ncbi:hypothetical protein ACHWQZ_G015136 [Mnemiopsis leidyi]
MRILEIIPIFVILWEVGIPRAQPDENTTQDSFACYRCETKADEDICEEKDDTCAYPKCAKIKYEENGIIKIIRECTPHKSSVAAEICSQSELLKNKPCDAWLCDKPLCNGGDRIITPAVGVNGAAQTLLSTIIVLTYFLVYG